MSFKPLLVCMSIVALCASLSPALAASGRTFVSGKGADSGACTVTAPCRSFAYAFTQTAVFGEILVLDSAGYGTVIITKSVSIIVPPGIEGSISVPANGTGIKIAVANRDTVSIEGITIDGQNQGTYGIDFSGEGRVRVVSCHFRNISNSDIHILGLNPNDQNTSYFIGRSTFSGMGSDVGGLAINANSSVGVISNVDVFNYYRGILFNSSKATLANSVISGNGIGVQVIASTVQLGGNIVSENLQDGVTQTNANLYSYGDNDINANSPDVDSPITTIPKQ